MQKISKKGKKGEGQTRKRWKRKSNHQNNCYFLNKDTFILLESSSLLSAGKEYEEKED